MYRKQYGEYAYWCWGVRVLRQLIKYHGWSYAVTHSVMKQTWSMYIVPRPFLYLPVNLLLERTLCLWTKILLTCSSNRFLICSGTALTNSTSLSMQKSHWNLNHRLWNWRLFTRSFNWRLLQKQMKYPVWRVVEIISTLFLDC